MLLLVGVGVLSSFHLKSLATYSFYQQDAVCGGWRTLVSHGNKTTMETEQVLLGEGTNRVICCVT